MYFPFLLTCTMGLTFTRRKSHVQGDIGIQSFSSMETREGDSLIRVSESGVTLLSEYVLTYVPHVAYHALGFFQVIHNGCESGHPQRLRS